MKLFSVLRAFAIGAPIGITFFDSVGYVARVEGISMQPILNPNTEDPDYVYLSCWSTRSFNISRGDVISLVSPKDRDQIIIKRVVGVPGDLVRTISHKDSLVRIPQGHCWVEGDHTGHSLDSNSFGPVAIGLVTAKATHIVWPPKRWQKLAPELPKGRNPMNLQYQSFDISKEEDNIVNDTRG